MPDITRTSRSSIEPSKQDSNQQTKSDILHPNYKFDQNKLRFEFKKKGCVKILEKIFYVGIPLRVKSEERNGENLG